MDPPSSPSGESPALAPALPGTGGCILAPLGLLSPPRSPRHAHQNLHLIHPGADEIPQASEFVDYVLIPARIADFRRDPKASNRSFRSNAGHQTMADHGPPWRVPARVLPRSRARIDRGTRRTAANTNSPLAAEVTVCRTPVSSL